MPADAQTIVAGGGGASSACCQRGGADVETPVRSVRADVMMVALVQGEVLLLLVLAKAFVEEVLLFSLSATPTQTTNPDRLSRLRRRLGSVEGR